MEKQEKPYWLEKVSEAIAAGKVVMWVPNQNTALRLIGCRKTSLGTDVLEISEDRTKLGINASQIDGEDVIIGEFINTP